MEYQRHLEYYRANKKSLVGKINGLNRAKEKEIDQAFSDAHTQSFSEIDCLNCANCCKTISPIFNLTDINRISRFFKMNPSDMIEKYLRRDEDGDYVLSTKPCPFLGDGNRCKIYHVRPKACREYPHTDHKGMKKHLKLVKKNLEVCPAVVDIIRKINL